jgi:hypothetical protein
MALYRSCKRTVSTFLTHRWHYDRNSQNTFFIAHYLASGVPNLRFDGFTVDTYGFGGKLNSYGATILKVSAV